MAGLEIQVIFQVVPPMVSAVNPAHEFVGFQLPTSVAIAPVTLTMAPPPLTVPLQFFDASFIWNLSPPGPPWRVSLGENVALPVTLLQVTVPAPVITRGRAFPPRRAAAPLELGIASTPTRVKSNVNVPTNPIGFRTMATSPCPSRLALSFWIDAQRRSHANPAGGLLSASVEQ